MGRLTLKYIQSNNDCDTSIEIDTYGERTVTLRQYDGCVTLSEDFINWLHNNFEMINRFGGDIYESELLNANPTESENTND